MTSRNVQYVLMEHLYRFKSTANDAFLKYNNLHPEKSVFVILENGQSFLQNVATV